MLHLGSCLDKVAEFHRALLARMEKEGTDEYTKQKVKLNQPFIPNVLYKIDGHQTAGSRMTLIKEESKELCSALHDETIEGVAKELADLLYVALATAKLYNIPIEAVFNRVHENNMLKIEQGHIDPPSGKLVKSADHPKVDLSDLFSPYIEQKEVYVIRPRTPTWTCPIGHAGCSRNCGNYGCGN